MSEKLQNSLLTKRKLRHKIKMEIGTFPKIRGEKMANTIIDIAELARTSKSTVSRYLNGGNIKASTAQAIDEAIRKLNYSPNINARRLVTNKTNVIGVVLDDISNPYYSEVLSGIQTVAGKNNYVCSFYSRTSNNKEESDYLSLFREGHIDGLILGTFRVRDEKQVAQLAESGYPIVLIGDCAENKNIDCVDVDNKQGTIDEVKYLHALGHREIAYLRGPRHMSGANFRAEGFVKGMKACGLDPKMMADVEWTVKGGYDATKKLLAEHKFTALLCSNEYCAYGAITALRDEGIRVPEDISVAAFDDGTLAQFTEPSITTVKQPFKNLGEMAVKHLVDILANDSTAKTSILLHPQLIERASCDGLKLKAKEV